MKKIKIIIVIYLASSLYLTAQQDTVIYNETTGNYIIQYVDEDDSLIIKTFVPWNKVNPSVKCSVSFQSDVKEYVYVWYIKNEEDSEQNLNSFLVEFSDSNITNNSTNGWHSGRWSNDEQTGYINRLDWFGDQGLEPTWEVGGFILSSPGIPLIGDSYFQGSGGSILSFSGSPPPKKILDEINKIDGFPQGYVKRKTIVPGKIPASIIPLDFVDTIKAYCDSSYQLGWIQSEGLLNSLTKKLENAKKYLVNNETEEAIELLNAFINEVEAQNGKKLTIEAYALLKFNAEYLIEKIKKE